MAFPAEALHIRLNESARCVAYSRGAYFSNFGSLGSIASHGCASDVQISCCGLYKLGSSKVPAAMPCPKSVLPPNNREPHSATETAHIVAHHFAGCAEVLWRAPGNFECVRRDIENRSVPSAGGFLAIPAMTIERHNWFPGNPITNCATGAAAGNRFHFVTPRLMKKLSNDPDQFVRPRRFWLSHIALPIALSPSTLPSPDSAAVHW